MTYEELYDKANRMLDNSEITIGEYEDMIEPLKAEIEPERKTGKWTTEEVAELLFNLFGDECACNYNGIDEWLPQLCKYDESTCPNPTEKHGCWMQFLIQGGADNGGEQE